MTKTSNVINIYSYFDGEDGVSITNVTRYYQLASSAPAKPTTKTPSGWTATEPTYVAGAITSLYVCDLVEFSDETWSYSDVSLSSSYSAAKDAYNRATAIYGTSATAAATVAKTATIPNFKSFVGALITIKHTYANTAVNPTLNVTNQGAKQIRIAGQALAANSPYNWSAGDLVTYRDDGTYWNIVDGVALKQAYLAKYSADTNAATFTPLNGDGGFIQDSQGNIYAVFANNLIMVGEIGSESGGNTIINSEGMDILKGDVVSASFRGKEIRLGVVADDSYIDFCGGLLEISADVDGHAGLTSDLGIFLGSKYIHLESNHTLPDLIDIQAGITTWVSDDKHQVMMYANHPNMTLEDFPYILVDGRGSGKIEMRTESLIINGNPLDGTTIFSGKASANFNLAVGIDISQYRKFKIFCSFNDNAYINVFELDNPAGKTIDINTGLAWVTPQLKIFNLRLTFAESGRNVTVNRNVSVIQAGSNQTAATTADNILYVREIVGFK